MKTPFTAPAQSFAGDAIASPSRRRMGASTDTRLSGSMTRAASNKHGFSDGLQQISPPGPDRDRVPRIRRKTQSRCGRDCCYPDFV